MNHFSSPAPARLKIATPAWAITLACVALLSLNPFAAAQNEQMQQKLMAVRESQQANKQKLAHYTWQETETISLKGEVKDTKMFQVQMGPNGQQQKTEISDQKAQAEGGGRNGRLKQRVVEKKKEEFQEYGQQIGALAKQYTTPDPDRLMQAKEAGNVSLQLGSAGTTNLVIKNYVKPGDTMTMTIDDQTKSVQSVQVNSYLDDPKDAVTISAQFAKLPDGTNHVASSQINGVSKQLVISVVNSNYQKM